MCLILLKRFATKLIIVNNVLKLGLLFKSIFGQIHGTLKKTTIQVLNSHQVVCENKNNKSFLKSCLASFDINKAIQSDHHQNRSIKKKNAFVQTS